MKNKYIILLILWMLFILLSWCKKLWYNNFEEKIWDYENVVAIVEENNIKTVWFPMWLYTIKDTQFNIINNDFVLSNWQLLKEFMTNSRIVNISKWDSWIVEFYHKFEDDAYKKIYLYSSKWFNYKEWDRLDDIWIILEIIDDNWIVLEECLRNTCSDLAS